MTASVPIPACLDAIADRLTSIPSGPGVYFLMAGGEVIYVGGSMDAATRIGFHNVAHELALFLPTSIADVWKVEKQWIERLTPPRNGKRGRPKSRPEKLVGFRLDVTPAEADLIRDAAAKCGEAIATFARKAVVERALAQPR